MATAQAISTKIKCQAGCQDHVKMVQSAPSEADAWKDYGAAMAKWIGAEKHPPTDEDARKFMVDEVNQGRETTS